MSKLAGLSITIFLVVIPLIVSAATTVQQCTVLQTSPYTCQDLAVNSTVACDEYASCDDVNSGGCEGASTLCSGDGNQFCCESGVTPTLVNGTCQCFPAPCTALVASPVTCKQNVTNSTACAELATCGTVALEACDPYINNVCSSVGSIFCCPGTNLLPSIVGGTCQCYTPVVNTTSTSSTSAQGATTSSSSGGAGTTSTTAKGTTSTTSKGAPGGGNNATSTSTTTSRTQPVTTSSAPRVLASVGVVGVIFSVIFL